MSEQPDEQISEADRTRLRIARDLRQIERMYADLEIEALYQSDDHLFPGGDALNLAGPVANVEAWQHRYEMAEAHGFGRGQDYADDQVDVDDHPLLVLATWEIAIREERDQPSDLRCTIARAAHYIAGSVEWMIAANFGGLEQLLRELSRVRARLEAVLHDGIRHTRGVPCMTCGQALVLVYGASESLDRWRCRECDEWSTPEQYMLAVKADYRANAEALTASDIEEAYRVKPGTLRQWAARGEVAKRGRDASGRALYAVSDVLRMRDRHAEAGMLA